VTPTWSWTDDNWGYLNWFEKLQLRPTELRQRGESPWRAKVAYATSSTGGPTKHAQHCWVPHARYQAFLEYGDGRRGRRGCGQASRDVRAVTDHGTGGCFPREFSEEAVHGTSPTWARPCPTDVRTPIIIGARCAPSRRQQVDRDTVRVCWRPRWQAPPPCTRSPGRLCCTEPGDAEAVFGPAQGDAARAGPGGTEHARSPPLPDLLGSDDFNIFYDAGTLIIIGAEPRALTSRDCWLAAEKPDAGGRAAWAWPPAPIGFSVAVHQPAGRQEELGLTPT